MPQAVSCQLVTAEAGFAPSSVHVGFVVDRVALGQIFLQVFRVPLSVSFHHGSPYSYVTCGMNSRPIGHMSET
jgi:hypothetical protein